MNVNTLLDALQNSALAQLVSKSDHLVGAGLQILHILGFILLLGSLVLVSLRLLGWILPEEPLSKLSRESARLFTIGLTLAVVSGLLIFIATPKLYVVNWAFGLKAAMFAAALLIHFLLLRRVVRADHPPRWLTRTAVGLSLTLWFGVSLAGRMIGFI